MSNFSEYFKHAILDWLNGSAFPAAPAGLYAAFYAADPGDDGTGAAEQTGNINGLSTRPAVGALGAKTADGTAHYRANSGEISLTTNAQNVGDITVTHICIWDDEDIGQGNLIYHGELSTPKTIANGEEFKINVNALKLKVD